MAGVKEQPALSAHGLVEFMTSSFQAREDILRRYKYQYPGQKVFAPYYQVTIAAIRAYHRAANDPAVLASAAEKLAQKLRFETRPKVQVRLRENMRAIASYERNFGSRRFEVPAQTRVPALAISGVSITCNPDLQVIEGGQRLVISLHCAMTTPEEEAVASLGQLMHTAYRQLRDIAPGQVRFLSVQSGAEAAWNGRGKKRWPQIQAACRQIHALWPHI